MPSVMQTMSGVSASIASQMASAAPGRGHVNHAGVGAGLFARLRDRVEDRQAEMDGPPLARARAADEPGAVGHRLLGMERAILAGEALGDDFGVGVDENGHVRLSALDDYWFRERVFAADGAVALPVTKVFAVKDICAEAFRGRDDLAVPVAQLVALLHDRRAFYNRAIDLHERKFEQTVKPFHCLDRGQRSAHFLSILNVVDELADHLS